MEDFVEALKQEIWTEKEGISRYEVLLKGKQSYLKSLEDQLVVIEQGKKATVAVAESQSLKPCISDLVKFAIDIPLILETILGELDFQSLLNSRFVSQSWNDAALNVLFKGKYSAQLDLGKLFESSDFDSIANVNSRLTKCIYFNGTCSCGDVDCQYSWTACESSKIKLVKFCKQFSTQIEVMNFQMPTAYAPTFMESITNSCPNLKALYLESSYCSDESQAADNVEMKSMPRDELVRMNLQTIEFKRENEYRTTYHVPLLRIIQNAPNLRRLKIQENFYPNLSNNKNLKYLHYNDKWDGDSLNLQKLSNMLNQVKDSLEVLKLNTNKRNASESFHFPVMKALKKLLNFNIVLYPMEQGWNNFPETIESKFPNLKHLKIGSYGEKAVESLLKRGAQKNKSIQLLTITTLIMDKIQDHSVLNHLKNWFPNLKKLAFTLEHFGPGPEQFVREGYNLEYAMLALCGIKLKRLVLTLDFFCQFSDVVLALDGNQELFEGMEILEIRAKELDDSENMSVVDDLQSDFLYKTYDEDEEKCMTMLQLFCNWLADTTTNMKRVSFHGFHLTGANAMRLILFIKEKNLPVNFENEDFY